MNVILAAIQNPFFHNCKHPVKIKSQNIFLHLFRNFVSHLVKQFVTLR